MFSPVVLSVLLFTLLLHQISAAPAPKLESDLQRRRPSSVAVPSEWTCNRFWYDTNDGCDCGCGATDPDCNKDDQNLYCHNSPLSPDTSRCDLRSNTCVQKPPAEWTCTENWYDTNDGCDCGCGATDPDCNKEDQNLYCHNSPLSPATSTCDLASSRCVPKDWTCSPSWYDTDDGCDCGCGVTDPDCNKEDQTLFCHNSPLSGSTNKCDLTSNRCLPEDWNCTPNWYDTSDGCDCECGATDPDCSKEGQTLYCHNSSLPASSARCNLASNICVPATGIHRSPFSQAAMPDAKPPKNSPQPPKNGAQSSKNVGQPPNAPMQPPKATLKDPAKPAKAPSKPSKVPAKTPERSHSATKDAAK